MLFGYNSVMKEKTKKITLYAGGFLIGIINGLLGAGGGMLAVPLLSKFGGMDQRTAQANSVAVILPLTVFSAVMYILRGSVNIKDAIIFIPTGLLGAIIGTYLIKKIPNKILKKIFAVFMIWAGYRMIVK